MTKVTIYHNGQVYEIPQEEIYVPFSENQKSAEADDLARMLGYMDGTGVV